MEEILASIRRIISDDEANGSAQESAQTTEYPAQVRREDADYEVADTQIIDDIARVLSGAGAPAGSEEDILDLTDLGGGDPIGIAVEELAVTEELVLDTEIYTETRTAVSFAAAFPPAYQDAYQDMAEAPRFCKNARNLE